MAFAFALEIKALPRKMGDLDGDGRATVVDLVQLLQHLNGTASLSQQMLAFADPNLDGKVNQADADFIRDAILGIKTLPDLKDTDRDGIPDLIEQILGLNPALDDSNSNGIKDGDEDADEDALSNLREVANGTDPLKTDSDGDGWSDEAEVSAGSNPLNPLSVPKFMRFAAPAIVVTLPAFNVPQTGSSFGMTLATPPVQVVLPSALPGKDIRPGLTMAQPPIMVTLPSAQVIGSVAAGMIMASPPVSVVLPSGQVLGGMPAGLTLAQPPLAVVLPSAEALGTLPAGLIVAPPPVTVVLPASTNLSGLAPGLTLAYPPISLKISGQ